MVIIKTKGKKNKYFFIKGFICILDSIVPILTAGFYCTDFIYKFSKWTNHRDGWNN